MNTRILVGMLAIGLFVAGSASALTSGTYLDRDLGVGTPDQEQEQSAGIAGLFSADAYAGANADYSGAVDAVDETKMKVAEGAKAAIDSSMSASSNAQAGAVRRLDAGVAASSDSQSGILHGIEANLVAFGGWFQGLWVKPDADMSHQGSVTAAHELVTDVTNNDGHIGLGVVEDLETTGQLEYGLPPPPKPETGFLGAIQMAFESFLAVN